MKRQISPNAIIEGDLVVQHSLGEGEGPEGSSELKADGVGVLRGEELEEREDEHDLAEDRAFLEERQQAAHRKVAPVGAGHRPGQARRLVRAGAAGDFVGPGLLQPGQRGAQGVARGQGR